MHGPGRKGRDREGGTAAMGREGRTRLTQCPPGPWSNARGLSAPSAKTPCPGSFTSNIPIPVSVPSMVPSRGLVPKLTSGKGRLRTCPGPPGGTRICQKQHAFEVIYFSPGLRGMRPISQEGQKHASCHLSLSL